MLLGDTIEGSDAGIYYSLLKKINQYIPTFTPIFFKQNIESMSVQEKNVTNTTTTGRQPVEFSLIISLFQTLKLSL